MAIELLVMRHAKSSWADQHLSDHDRPLNKRGLRDVPRMASFLDSIQLSPDFIFCSTAVRAKTTGELLVASLPNHEAELCFVDELYLAGPSVYIEQLSNLNGAFRVMLIGHNPGLEQLIFRLTKQDESMPTAAIAHIEFPMTEWGEFTKFLRQGSLIEIYRPKEIFE